MSKSIARPRGQAGFTLIEIAIVLVIIGLLLGGVLKGQELINNARVKSYANDFRNIPVYIYGYQDRFRALPGDDAAVATRIPGATLAFFFIKIYIIKKDSVYFKVYYTCYISYIYIISIFSL